MMSGSLPNYTVLQPVPRWPNLCPRSDGRYERNWPIKLAADSPIPLVEELQKKQEELSRELRSSIQAFHRLDAMSRGQFTVPDESSFGIEDYAVDITISSPTSLICTLIKRDQGGGVEDWYSNKLILRRLEEWLGPFSTIYGQPRAIWHPFLDTPTI
jgi:hypothetical protein